MNIIISSPIIYGRKIHWVGTLAMYTTLIIPSLVKAVRYRLPARRETRSAHNGQWRTIASPHVVSRDALPSRKAKAERTRVWAGEMPSNIPGHAPRARITFCYCRRPAVFSFCHNGATDSPERVQRSSYSRLKYREASSR